MYIKARGLQDPADKRNINLDAAMTEVFGTDKLTMFSLNKVLTPHLTAPVSSIAKIEGGVGCDMKSNGEGGSNDGEGEGGCPSSSSPAGCLGKAWMVGLRRP